jgi:GntR family transcriptional regulator
VDANKINHDGGLPPYRQLAAILARRIARGELARRLPSEKNLAQEYGVAQSTVRKALALLREAGLVRTHKGWGTEILPPGERR